MRWTGARLLSEVSHLAFLPSGPRLLIGRVQRVRVWDAGRGQLQAKVFAVGRWLTHLGAAADGHSWMLCADATVEVRRTGGPTWSQGPHAGDPFLNSAAALSGDGKRLVTAANHWEDKSAPRLRVSLRDAADGAEIAALLMDRSGDCAQLAVSADGGTVALPLPHDHALIWEPSPTPGRPVVPDEFRLGTAAEASGWQHSARPQRHALRYGHPTGTGTLALSADGSTLATVSGSRVIVWDAATGERIRTFTGHEGPVAAVAFAPAGPLLASVSGDDTFRLWDVAAKAPERLRLDCGLGWLSALAFSPDGLLVAVGGERGAKLYEVDERILS